MSCAEQFSSDAGTGHATRWQSGAEEPVECRLLREGYPAPLAHDEQLAERASRSFSIDKDVSVQDAIAKAHSAFPQIIEQTDKDADLVITGLTRERDSDPIVARAKEIARNRGELLEKALDHLWPHGKDVDLKLIEKYKAYLEATKQGFDTDTPKANAILADMDKIDHNVAEAIRKNSTAGWNMLLLDVDMMGKSFSYLQAEDPGQRQKLFDLIQATNPQLAEGLLPVAKLDQQLDSDAGFNEGYRKWQKLDREMLTAANVQGMVRRTLASGLPPEAKDWEAALRKDAESVEHARYEAITNDRNGK